MRLPRGLRLLPFVICLSLWPAVGINGYSQSNTGNTDETAIKAVIDQWSTAFSARDINGVMAVYAPDVIAYDIVPPLQYVGKDAYRKDYEEFFAQFKGPINLELRDLHISASGDLGTAICLERLSGTMANGQQSTMWVRATSIFRKEGGKWLDVHDHISVPADLQTGKARVDLVP